MKVSAARFTFRLANGGVVGPVSIHGAGGPIEMRYDAASQFGRVEPATAEAWRELERLLDLAERTIKQSLHVRSDVAS